MAKREGSRRLRASTAASGRPLKSSTVEKVNASASIQESPERATFYNGSRIPQVSVMATLSYNEIVPKTIILYNGEPYEVLSSHVFRMQQRKPVNQTKLRHLVSGKVLEISFHQNESVVEAEVGKIEANYLYTNRGESWFAEVGNAKNRFAFPEEIVHDRVQWLAPDLTGRVVTHDEKPLTVKIPIKAHLEVAEAPP